MPSLKYLKYDDTKVILVMSNGDGYGSEGSWLNEAYRILEFEKEPTGELLKWLKENGQCVNG